MHSQKEPIPNSPKPIGRQALMDEAGMGPAKPFLKWAGGKTDLLPKLRPLVPQQYGKYIEPFLGGGAFFFNLCPKRATISDSNEDLINAYVVVRDCPSELLEQLEGMLGDEETFYRIRETDPSKLDNVRRAARLIYLNKRCYNGLYRVNKRGKFNTPYGRNRATSICKREVIFKASKVLRNTDLMCDDFERILLEKARAGDFVYLDPPYPPTGRYSDFVRYTRHFFCEEDHLRLAKAVEEIDDRGCRFILSNAYHPLILRIYSRFRKIEVKAPRYVNCRGDRRGHVSEVLITNL